MFGDNLPGGSFHNDVLTAEPTDEAGKLTLLEELKKRAKGSLGSKNYPEAIQLYSKAIELFPNDAILHANRSMCHLGMGNGSSALTDAVSATTLDATYAKGYYRKGMAELKLNKHKDAKESFLQGIALVPDDKSFREQLDKLQASGLTTNAATGSSSSTTTTSVPKKSANATVSKPKKSTDDHIVKDTDDDTGSNVFRGYKKTSDGKTTTFFNNELDETTKALIGNITPKKIDAPDAPFVAPATSGSAWNSAGTFEERIFTPWAKERLSELFDDMHVTGLSLDSVVRLTKTDLSGDAAVTRNRGKVKHVYDFTATCDWELTVMESSQSPEVVKGAIIMNDITGDKDYDFEVTIDNSKQKPSADAMNLIKLHIKTGTLQNEMIRVCNVFYEEFNAKE